MDNLSGKSGSTMEEPRELMVWLICTCLITVVFIVDFLIPLGVAGGVPYISVILVSLWSSRKHLPIFMAVVCSMMTALGYFISPAGGEFSQVMFNRALALFAIWVTAFLALKWKMHEEEMIGIRSKVEEEKKKIYMATIHGAHHIINNLLNQLQMVKIEADSHSEFDSNTREIIDAITNEASALMDDLSKVRNMDEEEIKKSIYPK